MSPLKNKGMQSMSKILGRITAAAALAVSFAPAHAEQLIYGFQAEQFEIRSLDGENALVWDFDVLVGTDELKFVWRSEAEMGTSTENFEGLENQLRLQIPIANFFDAVIGVRASTPEGGIDRYNAILGVKGLAPQWFEIDADLFISKYPFFRFEAEYEALLTNRVILVPSIEVNMPLKDDVALNQASGGATIEVGARLSYDLIDRAVSPYIGVNYEKAFGGTADMMRTAGEETEEFSFVVGTRLLF